MDEPIPFRRKRRRPRPPRLPAIWSPYLRRRGVAAEQLRIMVWIGLLLGLLAWQALRPVPAPWPRSAPPPAVFEGSNPYAESERSREILREQEGTPGARTSGDDTRASAPVQVPAASVRVIDGDTFEYAGMPVRIADIDTPELRGRCAYETELARRARQRLRALLAGGDVEMHPAPGRRDEDSYGRKLRIVTQGGRSVGDVLVAEGLARTWTGRREPWCGGF